MECFNTPVSLYFTFQAKSNVVGYEDPHPKTGGNGRPNKYGTKVKLVDY
jgi:hypothetical protein